MNFYKKFNGYILFDDEGYVNEDGRIHALHLAFEFYNDNGKKLPLLTFKLKVEIENKDYFLRIEDHEVLFNQELKDDLKLIANYKDIIINYAKKFKNNNVLSYVKNKLVWIETCCELVGI